MAPHTSPSFDLFALSQGIPISELESRLNAGIYAPTDLMLGKAYLEENGCQVLFPADKVRIARELSELDKLKKENAELKLALEKTQIQSITDDLTGVYNRRHLDNILSQDITRMNHQDKRRANDSNGYSILMLDVDHFKNFNDNYGHQVGDRVLREFANILKSKSRDYDTIARYGGEEFTLILPEPISQALNIAERIRYAVETTSFSDKYQVTASIGATEFVSGDNMESLIKRADDALYQAKANGRNRVESLMPPTHSIAYASTSSDNLVQTSVRPN